MCAQLLTPAEYEAHLKDLEERLRLYLEGGEGSADELLKDAKHVLELADDYRQVLERHPSVEGLVAELLARKRQEQFLPQQPPQRSPGCALGWLFGRKKRD